MSDRGYCRVRVRCIVSDVSIAVLLPADRIPGAWRLDLHARRSKRFTGREPVDHVDAPQRLVGRDHVTGVPHQQHGERAGRGRVTDHLGGVVRGRSRQGNAPDGARRVLERGRSRPLERLGHAHGAAVRYDDVQLPRVKQHAVPAGVQQRGQPSGHRLHHVSGQVTFDRGAVVERPPAHVQRVAHELLLHVLLPVAVRRGFPVPQYVEVILHAGQVPEQRRVRVYVAVQHPVEREERGLEVAAEDLAAAHVLQFFELLLPVLCNRHNNIITMDVRRRTHVAIELFRNRADHVM